MALDLFGRKSRRALEGFLTNAEEQQKVAAEYFIKSFAKLSATSAEAGDTLIFQFSKSLPHEKRMTLMKNFDTVLKSKKFHGFYIPEDVDFVGVIARGDQEKEELRRHTEQLLHAAKAVIDVDQTQGPYEMSHKLPLGELHIAVENFEKVKEGQCDHQG